MDHGLEETVTKMVMYHGISSDMEAERAAVL